MPPLIIIAIKKDITHYKFIIIIHNISKSVKQLHKKTKIDKKRHYVNERRRKIRQILNNPMKINVYKKLQKATKIRGFFGFFKNYSATISTEIFALSSGEILTTTG